MNDSVNVLMLSMIGQFNIFTFLLLNVVRNAVEITNYYVNWLQCWQLLHHAILISEKSGRYCRINNNNNLMNVIPTSSLHRVRNRGYFAEPLLFTNLANLGLFGIWVWVHSELLILNTFYELSLWPALVHFCVEDFSPPMNLTLLYTVQCTVRSAHSGGNAVYYDLFDTRISYVHVVFNYTRK